jgi:catechol-2,3-dioxygenase
VGNFGFDLFQMEPGDFPKTDTRHLHFAFEIGAAELDKVEEQLKRQGIPYDGPKAHGGGTGLSIYFRDSDGYQLEVTAKFPDNSAYEAEIAKRGARYDGMDRSYGWKEGQTGLVRRTAAKHLW